MFKYVILILVGGLISCNNQTVNEVKEPIITDSVLYKKDIKQVEECYIANVEYYRLNPDELEHESLFEPYGIYYDDEQGYVKYSTPTKENIEIEVGAIYYKQDNLMAIIFMIVKNLKEKEDAGVYDSFCLIGLRENINQGFSLYPLSMYKQIRYTNSQESLSAIKFRYFNDMATTQAMWGKKFRTNLGDKDFWTNNLLFDKVITTDGDKPYFNIKTKPGEKLYWFQTFSMSNMDGESWGNHFKHNVVDCSNSELP